MKYLRSTILSAITICAATVFAQETALTTDVATIADTTVTKNAEEVAATDTVANEVPQDTTASVMPADSTANESPVIADTVATADSVTAADTTTAMIQDTVAAADTASIAADTVAAADTTYATDSTAAVDSSAVEPEAVPDVVPEATPSPSVATTTAVAATKLQGEINGFLKADKSPYIVKSDISIAANTVLVIEPGVKILFAPNTGLTVNQGQLVIAGSKDEPVVFQSAAESANAGDWKGIFITGDNRAEIRYAQISDAASGIVVENGAASIQNSIVKNTSGRGIYARNSHINVSDCALTENQVALHIDNYATANIERSKIEKNNVALLNSELAQADISGTNLENNEFGILDLGNSILELSNTKVSQNKTGISSAEVLPKNLMEEINGNTVDFNNGAIAVAALLPPSPEFPGIEKRPLVASDKVGTLADQREDENADSTQKSWNIIGNVMLGGNFHYVRTRTNHGETMVFGKDTVKHDKRFKNYYQVPGFGGEASAYLLMQGPNGRTIEFNADLTTDSWNHFSPNPVTIRYNDTYNSATVGDFIMAGGDIYMAGLPIFGAEYTLSLLKNNADQPLFQLNGFFGEAKRSLVPDARHPFMYNDYIDDGEAEAQRLAYGGYFKWAPLRRFDAKIGAIYASDELEDPLLRDGASASTTTLDPMVDAFTVYAEGNWLFFPGDIELNGQIAVGNADTANVAQQRALNKVFSNAGIEISSYGKLRHLMKHPEEINQLSNKELDEIFGDNLALSSSQKREMLTSLLAKAKQVQKQEEDDEDDEEFAGLEWGSQSVALAASLNWNFYKTHIEGHVKYVGEDFYSAGSPDQLSDVREFGARIEQGILNIWDLGVEYSILVENAANGHKTNLIGLGEGTHWGLFPDKESNWFDKHELDNDRTRYTQNAGIDNTFQIGSRIELEAGYNFEFKKQYRNLQLHGDYILDDEIYSDSWFAPRKDRTTDTIAFNGKSAVVDAERWSEYNALSSAPYLASKFHEKLFKHSWNAGVSLRAAKSIFKVNGLWTLRLDGSEFYKDELIEDMDLSNDTWAKLGYYYGGSNYFEQLYPISVTTTLNTFQNRFVVTPRYKSYKRDELKEMEISVTDELEKSFMNRFLVLSGSGDFRYMITDWEESGEYFDESEMDILGKINLRVNHTKHFYSEWYTGAAIYYRPDNLSSEYKDVYGGINLNYVF